MGISCSLSSSFRNGCDSFTLLANHEDFNTMKKIVEITSVEQRTDQKGKTYFRTHAILDNQEEHTGFGKAFKVGDEVEAWFDQDWDIPKMRKSKKEFDDG